MKTQWIPVPPALNSNFLETALAMLELDGFTKNHRTGYSDWQPPALVEAAVVAVQNIRDYLARSLDCDPPLPRTDITWQNHDVSLKPVHWESIGRVGEVYVTPALLLSGEVNNPPDHPAEWIHLVFVQRPKYGWEPLATNQHGYMAILTEIIEVKGRTAFSDHSIIQQVLELRRGV